MQIILSIWGFFQVNILTKPAFLIGLIVFIGYLLLRKPIYEAFAGFIKATVGYLILNVASGGLVSNFRPILAGLKDRFNLDAAVIDPYFGQAAAQAAIEATGRSFSLMMVVLLIAFLFNILLVAFRKITKIRTLFITGHVMVQQSSTALWMVMLFFPKMQEPNMVILLGILLGSYWAVGCNMTVEAAQEVTQGGGFAIAHQQMFGDWLAHKISPKLKGKNSQKIEDIKLPGFLSMMNDNIVSTGILMLIFFGIIMGILGPENMKAIDPSFTTQSFLFYIIEKSFNFAVYLSILQLGVKIFVAELTESFQGISTRLLPGSMAGVDCAALYGFTHGNVITLGFLFGALGQFLAIAGLVIFRSPILVITGFVPVFFDNATMAVIANNKGGFKAVAVITFVSGLIQVLGGAFAASYMQLAQYGGWHGNLDWDTVWPLIGVMMNNLQIVGVVICVVVLLAIPQIMYLKNKETYFMVSEDYEQYAKLKGLETEY